jgi:hypothetical protein
MAIAEDIKKLFKKVTENKLWKQEHLEFLCDSDRCRNVFSSGKFPIFIHLQQDLDEQQQRRFNTEKSRYYTSEKFKIEYDSQTYLLSNNLYESQRENFKNWFKKEFNLEFDNVMNFFYLKLSCPKTNDDTEYGRLIKAFENTQQIETSLVNIPNSLELVSEYDIIFAHFGGDYANKRKYFNEDALVNLDNAWLGVITKLKADPSQKTLKGSFFPFEKKVTKKELFPFPQFLDNLGCASKGIPNQAGLYLLETNSAFSFIEYLLLNEIAGTAENILSDQDTKNALINGKREFIETQGEIYQSPAYKVFSNSQKMTVFPNSRSSSTPIPKPFLLLAGISGTGKTRFVREQAKRSCGLDYDDASENPDNYKLVAVRPDWHEPSDLLGYVSRIDGEKYIATDFLKFLINAWKEVFSKSHSLSTVAEGTRPFWLCLDEMNLAPVEQYFADYLSILETRKWENGEYSSLPIISENLDLVMDSLGGSEEDELWQAFIDNKGIPIPPNLIVAGTVNMDETTHGFSRKVIDRALTLDFQEFFPNDYSEFFNQTTQPKVLGFSQESQINSAADLAEVKADSTGSASIEFLGKVNEILKNSPCELAYRALNELLLSVKCFNPADKKNLLAVWDDFLMQKVLPRIEGDAEKLRFTGEENTGILNSLKVLIEKEFSELEKDENNVLHRTDLLREKSDGSGDSIECPCKSLEKINWMQERLEQNQYTSFWA